MVKLQEILGKRTSAVNHIDLTSHPPSSAVDESHPHPQNPKCSTNSLRPNTNKTIGETIDPPSPETNPVTGKAIRRRAIVTDPERKAHIGAKKIPPLHKKKDH